MASPVGTAGFSAKETSPKKKKKKNWRQREEGFLRKPESRLIENSVK